MQLMNLPASYSSQFHLIVSFQVPTAEVNKYRRQVKDLLCCDSEASYEGLLQAVTDRWNAAFANHSHRNMEAVIRDRSEVFALRKMGFQQSNSGVTINTSESFNNILKTAVERKEVPADVLILVMQQIPWHYILEYHRGVAGTGRRQLRPDLPDTHRHPQRPSTTTLPMQPEELRRVIRGAAQLAPIRQEKAPPRPSYVVFGGEGLAEPTGPACPREESFFGYRDAGRRTCGEALPVRTLQLRLAKILLSYVGCAPERRGQRREAHDKSDPDIHHPEERQDRQVGEESVADRRRGAGGSHSSPDSIVAENGEPLISEEAAIGTLLTRM